MKYIFFLISLSKNIFLFKKEKRKLVCFNFLLNTKWDVYKKKKNIKNRFSHTC